MRNDIKQFFIGDSIYVNVRRLLYIYLALGDRVRFSLAVTFVRSGGCLFSCLCDRDECPSRGVTNS